MLPEEIPVNTRKHIETFHERIIPRTQDEVNEILAALLPIAREQVVTGKIQVNLNQGGVRSIDVERTEERMEA